MTAKVYDMGEERSARREPLIHREIDEALSVLGNLAVRYWQEDGKLISLSGHTELVDGQWMLRLTSTLGEIWYSLEDDNAG